MAPDPTKITKQRNTASIRFIRRFGWLGGLIFALIGNYNLAYERPCLAAAFVLVIAAMVCDAISQPVQK